MLVAISIPIFTSQLEKAREATDLANIRSAYAEVSAAILTGDDGGNNKITYTAASGSTPASASTTVDLVSTVPGFASDGAKDVAGIDISSIQKVKGQQVEVTVTGDGKVTIE